MPSNVAAVIELLTRRCSIELVRPFEHGANGTSLARLDGEPVVVKAWPTTPAGEQRITIGLDNATIMADRSVPIPRLLERGTIAGYSYLLYEFVTGEWPPRVTHDLAAQMLALTDLQRDAAARPATEWPADLARMIIDGDPGLDIHPERLRRRRIGQRLLTAAQSAYDACDPRHLRTTDIVHGDFAPENLLVRDGGVNAVVDWEQSRSGDVALDLAGMVYDIELGNKADPDVLADLYRAIGVRVPPDAWRLYVAIYAIRYASWSLGSAMEDDVLRVIDTVGRAGRG